MSRYMTIAHILWFEILLVAIVILLYVKSKKFHVLTAI